MTVADISRKAGPYDYVAGATYPFYFKVFESSDVSVTFSKYGAERKAVAGLDYAVGINADQDISPGGEVQLFTQIPEHTITISSCVPATQETIITNRGGFYPAVLNKAYDKLTILVQQLKEEVSRCAKMPISGRYTFDQVLDALYSYVDITEEIAKIYIQKKGNVGDLATHSQAEIYTSSLVRVSHTSRDYQVITSTAAALDIVFTPAAANVAASKVLHITTTQATTLRVSGATWQSGSKMPVWGKAGSKLALLAQFIAGRVILCVLDNS